MKKRFLIITVLIFILSVSILARNEFAFIRVQDAVLRTEPLGGEIIGRLNRGIPVNILETGERWTKVNIEGWVLTDSLSLESLDGSATLMNTSRQQPAELGDVVTFTRTDFIDGRVELEMELQEVISGEEAWQIIKHANIFNEEPGGDEEYILAKFHIRVNRAESDVAFSLTHVMFEAVSETGVVYTDFITVSGLLPSLRADLYEGAEHSGWTYFLVKKDDNPVVAFDRRMDSEQWFRLRY